MKNSYLLKCICLLGMITTVKAQTLTVEQSYQLAVENYPLIKQYELIEKTKEYTLSNANKAYLPQLSVTAIEGYVFGDFPSMGAGDESKFKFIGLAQINQTIWDGGATKTQKKIIEASSNLDKASVEVSLYDLRSRVNQLYFGILLIDEQLKQLEIQNTILANNIDKVKKLHENGLTYKTDVDEMKVEQLNLNRQKKDFQYTRNGYQTMLSYLIGKNINQAKLEKPLNKIAQDTVINRPEITRFTNQRNLITAQSDMQKVSLMPKVGLLGAGVVLAPGINLGPNKISTVGVAGLSVGWDIKGLYKNSNEKELTKQQLNQVNVQEETFLFNTRFQMNQKTADIERQTAILKDDEDIVKLRQTIREGYQLKYDTGAGPLIDLLNATQKEANARSDKALHEIQLLMSTYEYQTIKGN
ncbi:outer membrane protein TolC [Flavobacterium cutihirudinis]|uniref:Outer membrane protein TolC n=1 Tax=Flavobacterium cutihirudinis TaxID=1265740 RepID=A0A3D9FQA7_9FLAO|nr:TolC family protein [Flavobacterium cutihirudinis]RED22643.1 outer membrane protein TolC [Flavobacterium cutihirudinis]